MIPSPQMMLNALSISLIVLFLHYTSWTGHIFSGIKKLIKPEGKYGIYKAIYGCPVCMSPWYGTAIYFIFINKGIEDYILTIGATCGIAVIYVVLLTVRTACVNYNKHFEGKEK